MFDFMYVINITVYGAYKYYANDDNGCPTRKILCLGYTNETFAFRMI